MVALRDQQFYRFFISAVCWNENSVSAAPCAVGGPWTDTSWNQVGQTQELELNKNSKCRKQNFVGECFCSYDKFCRTTNFVVRHLDFVVAYNIFVKRFITMIKKKCRRKNSICRRQNCRNFVVTTFIIICRRHTKKNVVGFWMEFGGEAGVFGLPGFSEKIRMMSASWVGIIGTHSTSRICTTSVSLFWNVRLQSWTA